MLEVGQNLDLVHIITVVLTTVACSPALAAPYFIGTATVTVIQLEILYTYSV